MRLLSTVSMSFALALAGCTLMSFPPAAGTRALGPDGAPARRARTADTSGAVAYIDPSTIRFKTDGVLHARRLHFGAFVRNVGRTIPLAYVVGKDAGGDGVAVHGSNTAIDAPDLEVGAPYRLEIRIGNRVIGAQPFAVVEEQGQGGKKLVVIDQRPAFERLYVYGNMVQLDVPVDARADRRVTVAEAVDGKLVAVESQWVMAPSLEGVGGLYRLAPYEDTRDFHPLTNGHHEMAAVVDGVLAGSWSWDIAGDDWHGFDFVLPAPKGNSPGSGVPHADPEAKIAIDGARRGNAEEAGPRDREAHTYYSEGVVCAVALDPQISEALHMLHSGERAMTDAGYDAHDALITMNDEHATDSERHDASRTLDAVDQNTSKAGAILARARAKVMHGAAAYHKGCLAKLVPPGVVLAPEARVASH